MYDIVIPSISEDVEKVINLAERYLRLLGGTKIIIITNKTTIENMRDRCKEDVELWDEDRILPIKKGDLDLFFEKKGVSARRSGWYYQQFLKLGYAFICKNKYYLVWDADTIPLRKIEFFDKDGTVLFNEKTEYNKPYFQTLKQILDIEKVIQGSFITEHMMFEKEIVIRMIDEIEKIGGQEWIWKIMNSISTADLAGAGFSEYETYGTYLFRYYPSKCAIRKLKTLRDGGSIISVSNYSDERILDWFGKHYDSISFEKYDIAFHRDIISRHKWITAILPSSLYVIGMKIKNRIKHIICH